MQSGWGTLVQMGFSGLNRIKVFVSFVLVFSWVFFSSFYFLFSLIFFLMIDTFDEEGHYCRENMKTVIASICLPLYLHVSY